MTLAIRAELLCDEREVVLSALNRTTLTDPDSSTQRYLNNHSGHAVWDVNKHRNSHLHASWVYLRQFYSVFLSPCRNILHTVTCFTKWWTLLWTAEASWGSFHTQSWYFHLFTSLSQFEICCWHQIQNADVNVETSGFQIHSLIPLVFPKILL